MELPLLTVEAFAAYGRGEETMKVHCYIFHFLHGFCKRIIPQEIPGQLRQLGRIQPQQLWPYFEQVKPLKVDSGDMLLRFGEISYCLFRKLLW